MDTEVKTAEKAKIRPFNVMDQMVAHRLALEGFEILKVVPSNKYAKEAHFIFSFNASSAFKKRFKELLNEVEKEKSDNSTDTSSASEAVAFQKEKAEMAASIQKLTSENAALKQEICEKDAQIKRISEEKAADFNENSAKNCENSAFSEENSNLCELQSAAFDNSEVLDKLAEIQALGNCILGTVSAIGFQMNLYKNTKEG